MGTGLLVGRRGMYLYGFGKVRARRRGVVISMERQRLRDLGVDRRRSTPRSLVGKPPRDDTSRSTRTRPNSCYANRVAEATRPRGITSRSTLVRASIRVEDVPDLRTRVRVIVVE